MIEPSRADSDGVTVRALSTVEEIFAAAAVLREVWGGDTDPIPANLLRALEHSGNYVVGLWVDDRMIGASVAFFHAPAERAMHSHVTGILPHSQRQGLGRALKAHQREWALERGVGHITWTFDPLVARNAHFNLSVVGARVTDYLVDQYGPMADGVNRGDESDRLMVSWALAAPPARRPDDSEVVAAVAIPPDIETIRATDAAAAAGWRRRVRGEFQLLRERGLVVAGFDDERGYLFSRGESAGS